MLITIGFKNKVTIRVDSELSMRNVEQSITHSWKNESQIPNNYKEVQKKLSPKSSLMKRLFSKNWIFKYFLGKVLI